MAIIHKKIEKNLNPNLKCGVCSESIKVGKSFYIWVNNIPNLPQEDGRGGDICEDCYLKDQGLSENKEPKEVELQVIFRPTHLKVTKNVELEKLYKHYLEYSELSITERNKKIIGIFPEDFWDNLRVTTEDVIYYADFLVDRGLSLNIALNKKEDKWLAANALEIIQKIQEATKNNGELSSDGYFLRGVSEISSGELLDFGIKMFNSLPEDKKKIGKSFYEVKMWAEVTSNGLAELSGFYKSAVTPPPFSDFVKRVGFFDYINWIRGLQSDEKLSAWAENYYTVLLSINLST